MLGSFIAHEANPMVINKNENSLIWPKLVQAKKLFFLVCHISPNTSMVIIGFITSTNRIKHIISGIYWSAVPKFTPVPKSTKNITIKKSLNDFILLVISNLYEDVAKVIPATNAPISMPKPNQ